MHTYVFVPIPTGVGSQRIVFSSHSHGKKLVFIRIIMARNDFNEAFSKKI